jgi:hypothetical protein
LYVGDTEKPMEFIIITFGVDQPDSNMVKLNAEREKKKIETFPERRLSPSRYSYLKYHVHEEWCLLGCYAVWLL